MVLYFFNYREVPCPILSTFPYFLSTTRKLESYASMYFVFSLIFMIAKKYFISTSRTQNEQTNSPLHKPWSNLLSFPRSLPPVLSHFINRDRTSSLPTRTLNHSRHSTVQVAVRRAVRWHDCRGAEPAKP
jgi:hypothetical protein